MSWLSAIVHSQNDGLPIKPIYNPQTFQSNIKGIYIAGALTNAPLIKNAFWQGYQLGTAIAKESLSRDFQHQVVIVGAGPSGIGAAMALHRQQISFQIVERRRTFATIDAYPLGKIIFNQPDSINLPEDLWFEDSTKEHLVERWTEELNHLQPFISLDQTVTGIQKHGHGFSIEVEKNKITAHKVILATGLNHHSKFLNVEGEKHPQILHSLQKAQDLQQTSVIVIGGGSSALETAFSLIEHNCTVTLIHRGGNFPKATPLLQSKIQQAIAEEKITIHFESVVTQFHHRNNTVLTNIQTNHQEQIITLQSQWVVILIGATPSLELFQKMGLQTTQNRTDLWKILSIPIVLLTYLFYTIKGGLSTKCATVDCSEFTLLNKIQLYPFRVQDFGHPIVQGLHMDLGFRSVDGSFWGTLLYSAVIVIFALKAMKKYTSVVQKRRYISLMVFQAIFLFGIPEIVVPLLINYSQEFWSLFGGFRPWKWYSVVIPWPLSIFSIIDSPEWLDDSITNRTQIALSWTLLGGFVSFALIPLYVKKNGLQFCSYLCGCGGLSETLGDMFRHLSPKSLNSKKYEWANRILLVFAALTTFLILNDIWKLVASDALYSVKNFSQHWYGLMVDFALASVLGVALYPYLGNRAWCRFLCPLRGYMEIIAKHTSKLSIDANDKCIACQECNSACQMGIPVQQMVLSKVPITNQNSNCIQCGICIEVCPMNVLSIGKSGETVQLKWPSVFEPPTFKDSI